MGILSFVIALANFGMPLPIRSTSWFDSPFLAAGFCSMDLPSSAIDFNTVPLGFFLSIRSFGCVGPPAPVVGTAMPGPAMFLQSVMQLSVSMSLVDFTSLGTLLPSKLMSHLGLFLLVLGLACSESVFALLVVSTSNFEVSMLLQGFSCSGLLPAASCGVPVGSLLSLRSSGCCGAAIPALGVTRLEFMSSLPVPDVMRIGPFMFPRSFGKLEPVPPVLSMDALGAPLFAQKLSWSELSTPPFGCIRSEPLLPVAELSYLETPLAAQSLARSESLPLTLGSSCLGSAFALLVLDFLHLGFSLIARSLAQFEKSIFVPDFLHSDLLPPVQQLVQADLFLPVLGTSALGSLSFLPVADTCSMGLSLFPHTSSQAGVFMLAPSLCLEPSLFLHSLVRPDASSSHSGTADYGAFRTLFVVGFVSLGFSFLLRSFAYMDSAAPALSFSHSEALLLSRALAQVDLPLLSPGPSCMASFVPVLGAYEMDALVFPQGLACLALLLPVLNFNAMELPSLVRNLLWPGFSLLFLAGSKVSTSLVFDFALLELLLPARTSVCLDSFLSMFSSINLGLLSSLQSFCRTELPVLPLGLQRLGPVFAVPVVDSAIPGPALPSRSLMQLELLTFPTNMASLDASLLLRGIC